MLIAFGLATVAFDLALLLLDKRLEATGGPSILGLEFAGSERQVERIMGEWGEHGLHLARPSLWLDFGFMLSYGAFSRWPLLQRAIWPENGACGFSPGRVL